MSADTRIQDFITYRNRAVAAFPTCLKPWPVITEDDGQCRYMGYNVAKIPVYNVPPGFDMAANQVTYGTGTHEPGHEYEDYLCGQDPTKAHRNSFLQLLGFTDSWDTLVGRNTPYNWFNDPGEIWADGFSDAVNGEIKFLNRHVYPHQVTAADLLAFFLGCEPAAHNPTAQPVPVPPTPAPISPSLLFGADISNWQGGNVDFDQLKTAVQFVVIKATEGVGFKDPEFDRNWSEAQRVGLARGAYHFAHPELNGPEDEADYFCNEVSFSSGDFAWLDWETQIPAGFPIADWCRRFCVRVKERTGVSDVIYLNQAEVDQHEWSPFIDAGFGLSLADYEDPLNSTPWPVVAFRQYTSHGAVAGIPGAADLDVFYGDLTALHKYGAQEDEVLTKEQVYDMVMEVTRDRLAAAGPNRADPQYDLANTTIAIKDVLSILAQTDIDESTKLSKIAAILTGGNS